MNLRNYVLALVAAVTMYAQDQPPLHVATCVVSSSGTDTYTAAATPALSGSYVNNQVILFIPNFTNVGAATLDCGAGAKSVVKTSGAISQPLDDGDMVSGTASLLIYNTTADNFTHISRVGSIYIPASLKSGATDPATCAVGNVFINTTSGATLKLCSATNTWSAVSGGGGGGSGISAWAASTAYTTSSVVYTNLTVNSIATLVIWKAGASCTSGATFNSTEITNCTWTVMSGATTVYNFTASGTWTKPLGVRALSVCTIGPGGGGGAGARRATSSGRSGGGSGGAGGRTCTDMDAATVGATETITIGTGGAGGSAITADDTNGGNGSNGSSSTSFGNHIKATAGGGGAGGSTTAGTAGSNGTGATSNGASGGGGTTTTGSGGSNGTLSSGSGGGGAGAATSSTVNAAGGAGASCSFIGSLTVGAGGTTGGTAATSGQTDDTFMIGSGGGGGYYRTGVAGGTGANGAGYGSGGGGGGASDNGNNSGAGGNGADGYVRIIARF